MNINIEVNPLPDDCVGGPLSGDVLGRIGTITPPPSSGYESSTLSQPLDQKLLIRLQKSSKVVANKLEEKKRRRKKKWKKPKDKPSRPLSAYNLFFRSERSAMLGHDAPSEELESLKKRVHCKTHGKIGFAEMARAIGARWKALEPDRRKPLEDLAMKEKDRYIKELAVWKNAQEEKRSKEGQKQGLNVIATAAAMASSPINSLHTQNGNLMSNVMNTPSDSFRLAMADEFRRRNMTMLQHRPNNLSYILALQDRQLPVGLPQFDSSLMNYPNAAEASASALLQQFQGSNHMLPQSQNNMAYTSNPLATMRQLQYNMSNNRNGIHDAVYR